MTRFAKIMAAAALAGLFAAPAVAQPYPGTYPGQPYGSYPGQPYGGYGGGYGSQGVIGTIIDGLIGNRYAVSDRQAVRQCAYAAVQRAESQYRPYFNGQPYAYQGYSGYVRVTAITDVSRRSNGRISGARPARYRARRLRRRRLWRRGRPQLPLRRRLQRPGL